MNIVLSLQPSTHIQRKLRAVVVGWGRVRWGGVGMGWVSHGTQVLSESVAWADSRLCELLAGP